MVYDIQVKIKKAKVQTFKGSTKRISAYCGVFVWVISSLHECALVRRTLFHVSPYACCFNNQEWIVPTFVNIEYEIRSLQLQALFMENILLNNRRNSQSIALVELFNI